MKPKSLFSLRVYTGGLGPLPAELTQEVTPVDLLAVWGSSKANAQTYAEALLHSNTDVFKVEVVGTFNDVVWTVE